MHPVQTLIVEKKRRQDLRHIIILRIYDDGSHRFYRVPEKYWNAAVKILEQLVTNNIYDENLPKELIKAHIESEVLEDGSLSYKYEEFLD